MKSLKYFSIIIIFPVFFSMGFLQPLSHAFTKPNDPLLQPADSQSFSSASTKPKLSKNKTDKPSIGKTNRVDRKVQVKSAEKLKKPSLSSFVPLRNDQGILVTDPSRGFYHRGETLPVRFSFSRELSADDANKFVIISILMKDGGNDKKITETSQEVQKTGSGEIRVPQEIDLTIPLLTPSPSLRYYVNVRLDGASVLTYGQSDYFSIGVLERAPGHESLNYGIIVQLEPDKRLFFENETFNVRFRYTGEMDGGVNGDFLIYLSTNVNLSRRPLWTVLRSTGDSGWRYNYETQEYTVPLTIPPGMCTTTSCIWKIIVYKGDTIWGTSHSFYIQVPPE